MFGGWEEWLLRELQGFFSETEKPPRTRRGVLEIEGEKKNLYKGSFQKKMTDPQLKEKRQRGKKIKLSILLGGFQKFDGWKQKLLKTPPKK